MPAMMVWPVSFVGVGLEGRVFFASAERDAHLFLTGLGLGLDRNFG